jgi:3-phenylpropionate/trans-cinnamate dioxygenase ferredoxin component
MSLVEIAQTDQVPAGTMKSFSVNDKMVLVINIEGKIYAMGNKCTHFGGDLSKGKLEGNVVTCPRHGARFDVASGNPVKGPAKKSEPVYEVKVDGKSIKVDI